VTDIGQNTEESLALIAYNLHIAVIKFSEKKQMTQCHTTDRKGHRNRKPSNDLCWLLFFPCCF